MKKMLAGFLAAASMTTVVGAVGAPDAFAVEKKNCAVYPAGGAYTISELAGNPTSGPSNRGVTLYANISKGETGCYDYKVIIFTRYFGKPFFEKVSKARGTLISNQNGDVAKRVPVYSGFDYKFQWTTPAGTVLRTQAGTVRATRPV